MDEQIRQAVQKERELIISRINELSVQFSRSSCLAEWQECAEYIAEQIEKMEH